MNKKYLLLAALFIALQFTAFFREAEARFTATIYMTIKHSDKQLDYQGLQYEPHFDQYMVTYQDENGNTFSIAIFSKQLPFVVIYDPLDQPV
ncbi:hypothetical protein CBW65_07740 [Tumebacillus avium]|uniref:DUF3139 domain-containing protein n=1 Tax=Tumebacillus avium TaxID=1903704 RepID=A0A1Y0ILR2_9BACL|nr:hypothetical protein [Tumebacillus avium]ARU60989.1 hypothetical protein CBW65_07740 [Tumebacillus avium]